MTVHENWGGLKDYIFDTQESKKTSYEEVFIFPFHGSDVVGTPLAVSALMGTEANGVTMSARVYDITNRKTIAEVIGFASLFPDTATLTVYPENVPELPAIWELQILRSTGSNSKKVYVTSLTMEY